jgi:hypothetical protein
MYAVNRTGARRRKSLYENLPMPSTSQEQDGPGRRRHTGAEPKNTTSHMGSWKQSGRHRSGRATPEVATLCVTWPLRYRPTQWAERSGCESIMANQSEGAPSKQSDPVFFRHNICASFKLATMGVGTTGCVNSKPPKRVQVCSFQSETAFGGAPLTRAVRFQRT